MRYTDFVFPAIISTLLFIASVVVVLVWPTAVGVAIVLALGSISNAILALRIK